MATHPVFSGNAYENLNKEDNIDKIITNTIEVRIICKLKSIIKHLTSSKHSIKNL